ncbi:MAG: hypothetical protein KKH52_03880 [Nanoarchaeota archaeon]|nr:hypothetical protein [Nanoarchaeota archaeon]MBU1622545.1 hypothetical protein [Nanoarchaeota archaeon]MBU1974508.1 hypothetical protein [Nanoarchaeota archaeon]
MNKKGFILTLDVILGMTIVFLVLIVSLFFITQGSAVSISDHQLLMVGSDIVGVMDQEGTLDSLDYATIETRLEEILPANYEMLLRIEGDFTEGNGTIEIGGELPEERLRIVGKKVGLTNTSVYLKLTYFVWSRNNE